uniref:Uncharacterized protein n=1 Tax=Arundo donax TaxID=35708 RepID=A0A0A9T2Z9_ARUDO
MLLGYESRTNKC